MQNFQIYSLLATGSLSGPTSTLKSTSLLLRPSPSISCPLFGIEVRDVPYGLRSNRAITVVLVMPTTLPRCGKQFRRSYVEGQSLIFARPLRATTSLTHLDPNKFNHHHSLSSMIIATTLLFVCSRSCNLVQLSALLGWFFKIRECLFVIHSFLLFQLLVDI